MKNLLYTTAFGDALYFRMVQEMVHSARRQGFVDEIVVLTDRAWVFQGAVTFTPLHEPGDLRKAEIRKTPGFGDYEKILFVDSDIVFLKNPDILFAYAGFRCAVEKIPLANAPLGARYLTPKERERHLAAKSYCMNSGTVLMPSETASRFLREWEAAWQVQPKDDLIAAFEKTLTTQDEMLDQSALHVYCERRFKNMELFHENAVFMPGIAELFPSEGNVFAPDECVAIHFNGPIPSSENKESILFCMQLCADPEKIPEVIAGFRERIRASKPKTEIQGIVEYCEKSLKDIHSRLEKLEKKEGAHAHG